MKFSVTPQEDRHRVDHVLAARLPEISRSFLQSLCKRGQVLVNKQAQKSGYKVRWQDTVEITHDMSTLGKTPDIEVPIVYEDEQVLVVNKPSGVLSHALSKFKQEPSVASFLRQHMNKQDNGIDIRFGIVHRLDRVTSGLMICAKDNETMKHLQKQFADRSIKKSYTAVVGGIPKEPEALIDVPIERNPKKPATFRVGARGKSAQTTYKIIRSSNDYSLLALTPKTGRTHQLRVHCAYINLPIVGDFLYGGEVAERLYLHAHKLTLQLPKGETKTFEAPIPQSFNALLEG